MSLNVMYSFYKLKILTYCIGSWLVSTRAFDDGFGTI